MEPGLKWERQLPHGVAGASAAASAVNPPPPPAVRRLQQAPGTDPAAAQSDELQANISAGIQGVEEGWECPRDVTRNRPLLRARARPTMALRGPRNSVLLQGHRQQQQLQDFVTAQCTSEPLGDRRLQFGGRAREVGAAGAPGATRWSARAGKLCCCQQQPAGGLLHSTSCTWVTCRPLQPDRAS